MPHSKSCRCQLCCPSYPDRNSHDCYHWKNRFCKLRKQWSEHSKCGSVKHIPEDCTHSRSPCDKTVGRFGVAWVAEIPGCDNGEPKGWQVEIVDTPQCILKKCKELIEWLNNPPAHLFDSIKGNERCCSIQYPKCSSNNCKECWEEPCCMKEPTNKCEEVRIPKRCRLKCCEYKETDCISCRNSQTRLCNSNPHTCPTRLTVCQNKCCEEHHPRSDDECSDCCGNTKPRHSKCRWSTPVQKEDDIFRKESCCCHCQQKFYKNAGTTYETDIVPQKDHPDYTIKSLTSDMDELDSKVICAHVRTSQICKKIKEDRRNQLIDKHEKELNTVIASRSSDEETTKSLFMSSLPDNQSTALNNSLANSSQRRSSKFRRRESN